MAELQKIAERLVRAVEPGAKKYRILDSELRGFGMNVYPSGARTFDLEYWMNGRNRRIVIGRYPEWSAHGARERAKEIRREVEDGGDPLQRKIDAREAPMIPDLIDLYIKEHIPRLSKRNGDDQVSMLRKLVEPQWRHMRVTEVTPIDVDRLLTRIASGRARPAKANAKTRGKRALAAAKPTPVRANRTGEVLRKMFNLAVKRWKLRDDNPAADFHRRPEIERDRFLSVDEIRRLAAALEAAEDQRSAGVVRMALLTGARLSEVREARFEEFDLDRCLWIKLAQCTKQRRVHRVPISADAAALIRLRRKAVPETCPWLFPGDVEGKPIQDIRRFWNSIRTESGLPDVRIHDLRHSFAALLVSGGASLPMVGKLLGHSRARTTLRYAHLADDPLRGGVEAVAAALRPRPRVVGGSTDPDRGA